MNLSLIPEDRSMEVLAIQDGDITIQPRLMPQGLQLHIQAGDEEWTIWLTLPTVMAVRFEGDMGVYGHTVQHTNGARYIVRPRLRSSTIETAAQNNQHPGSQPLNWRFETYWDRLGDAVLRAIRSNVDLKPTGNVLQTRANREIRRIVTGSTSFKPRPTAYVRGSTLNSTDLETEEGWDPFGMPDAEEVGLNTEAVLQNNEETNTPATKSGMQVVTDATLEIIAYELELGYPAVPPFQPGYLKLAADLKDLYLKAVLPFGCPLFTGKQRAGRFIGRTQAGDVQHPATGRPVPFTQASMNPFLPWGNPARIGRENRSTAGSLKLVDPHPIEQHLIGHELPEAWKDLFQRCCVVVSDAEGILTWTDGGGHFGLDGIGLTPSGRRKLAAFLDTTEILTADQYWALKAMDPDLEAVHVPEQVGTIAGNLPLYQHHYRVTKSRASAGWHDKLKCPMGGLKGVGKQIDQLWVRLPDECPEATDEPIEVDLVITEDAFLNKAPRDAIMAIAASWIQDALQELDPTWTTEQLVSIIQEKLAARKLDPESRFEVLGEADIQASDMPEWEGAMYNLLPEAIRNQLVSKTAWDNQSIGTALCGFLPISRAPETESQQQSHKGLSMSMVDVLRQIGLQPTIPEETYLQAADLCGLYGTVQATTA